MGLLSYNDPDFWLYAVQLARRGLFPVRAIVTIHGPHSGGLWGHVECAFHEDREYFDVRFVGTDSWHGLRFMDDDDPEIRFPVLKPSAMTERARHWLHYADRKALTV